MNEDLKHLSLVATYEVDDSFDSDRFIKLRLRVAHDGENPNGSSFSLEDMDRAKDSIKNIPILAAVVWDGDGKPQFGSHDMHIEQDKVNEGKYRLIYDEQPLGLVPETNNYEVAEYNNKNYIYTDCFIWVGYSNYGQDIIKRDGNIKLSMEIIIDAYKYDSKTRIYKITDYRYKGITLLGNNIGTGMIDALATTESFSETSKEKLITLMSELKDEIIKYQSQSSSSEVDINKNDKLFSNNREEGNKLLDEKIIELLGKYNLTADTVDFKINELSFEELQTKLEEKYGQNNEPKKDYAATYNQRYDALTNALDGYVTKDSAGNVIESVYYYPMDFDNEWVFVKRYYWDDSGNYESTNGRFAYNFNEESVEATITSEFEEMYVMWLTKDEKQEIDSQRNNYESIKSEFDSYKETHVTPEIEVEVLRTFQNDRLSEDRKNAEEQIFAKFDELLGDNEEYKTLKKKSKDYSIDNLVKECNALYGGVTSNFSLNTGKKSEFTNVRVDTTIEEDDSTYGGLFAKHAKKKNE